MTIRQALDLFASDPDLKLLLEESELKALSVRNPNDTLAQNEFDALIAFCDRITAYVERDIAELNSYEKQLLSLEEES